MPKRQLKKSPARKPVKRAIVATLDPATLAQLAARNENRSEQIRLDLSRYYQLLAEARIQLRQLLTPAELSAIIDIQNGHWYAEYIAAREITANIEDGCRFEGLDTKWGIDGPTLIAKLNTLDPLSLHALADATQRFWQAVGEGDERRPPHRALD